MFYSLPPVGNRICLDRGANEAAPDSLFPPYRSAFFASGTMALAAAIRLACRRSAADRPEVIMPAYGCPDLVSAARHAGVRPVLADLEPGRPWMNLDQVRSLAGSQTVAIIATGFLGIPERMDALRRLASEAGVTLIEDSAQVFPAANGGESWSGDLVVLSFGRGKPVSLLGGGALLYKDDSFASLLPDIEPAKTGPLRDVSYYLYAWLYNRLLSPRVYGLLEWMPFLHLGETRYRPLSGLQAMDATRLALLPANIRSYRERSRRMVETIHGMLAEPGRGDGIVDLPAVCNLPMPWSLLRYPLLVDAGRRSDILRCLARKGLGVSLMYPAILPGLPDIPARVADPAAFPAARDFAARLITLPVHERVTQGDVRLAGSCLADS